MNNSNQEWRCLILSKYYALEIMLNIIDGLNIALPCFKEEPQILYMEATIAEFLEELYCLLLEVYSLASGSIEPEKDLDTLVKEGKSREQILEHIKQLVNKIKDAPNEI